MCVRVCVSVIIIKDVWLHTRVHTRIAIRDHICTRATLVAVRNNANNDAPCRRNRSMSNYTIITSPTNSSIIFVYFVDGVGSMMPCGIVALAGVTLWSMLVQIFVCIMFIFMCVGGDRFLVRYRLHQMWIVVADVLGGRHVYCLMHVFSAVSCFKYCERHACNSTVVYVLLT